MEPSISYNHKHGLRRVEITSTAPNIRVGTPRRAHMMNLRGLEMINKQGWGRMS